MGGCAAPPQTAALRAAWPAGLPRRLERLAVPFFPQTPFHCGPAALATALADVGLPADPEALAQAVFLPARGGSLALEMQAGARRQGAVSTRVPGELTALLRELNAGHAVVILQNLGLAIAPRWHYAVLVGYDLDADELLLRSGTERRMAMRIGTFEHTWARGEHWAMVVLPPGRLPATATEAAAADAALGFERVAPPAAAVSAWQAVLERWPANLLAGLGLGNSAFAAGDLPAAAGAFAAAAARHDSAVAWNNLARVQWQRGDAAAARAAAARAVARAESAEPAWRDAARATLALVSQPAPR